MPLDTTLRPPPGTEAGPVPAGRVRPPARRPRAVRRIVWAGAGVVALVAGVLSASGMLEPPSDAAVVTRTDLEDTAGPVGASRAGWRTATPVLLAAAPASPEPAPAAAVPEPAEVPAAAGPEPGQPALDLPAEDRPGPSARVSLDVSVREPGAALPAPAASPAAGTPRVAGGSSGFVTLDVTVSEAVDVAGVTGVLAPLEPFDYRDDGDGTITIDPGWVQRNITTAEVPLLGTVRCHRAVIGPLTGALQQVADEGLAAAIDPADYGGCWVARRIDRSPAKPLSMHAWGLAIDMNVSTNGLGATPTMNRRVVDVFRHHGFAWGGDWSRPDGMHFELHVPR